MNIFQLKAKYLGKGKRKVVGIVLHDTFGTGTHKDTLYLANPSDGRKVSADFTVEKDGTIYQLNPDLENGYSFHAGRATKYKGLINQAVMRGTIGIEICQSSKGAVYPDAQLQAIADLCRMLLTKFNLTAADITTHAKIITDGSRTDPRDFPFDKFYALLGSVANKNIIGGGDTVTAGVVLLIAAFGFFF